MDQQASNLLVVLQDAHVSVDTKLDLIDKLKSYIKHHVVPENAVTPTFDVIRLSLSFSQLQDSAFSVLSHMTKRMMLQHQQDLLVEQGARTYPAVLERLGDVRDRVQLRAIQCLTDFWQVSPQEVEGLVQDQVLTSVKPRTRKAGVQWVGRTHRDHNLPFKSFVPLLVRCLEENDPNVSEVARSVIIDLFKNAPDGAKADLNRQLRQKSTVHSGTADAILSQVGYKSASAAATPKRSPASSRVLSEKPDAPQATAQPASSVSQASSSLREVTGTKGKKSTAVPPGIEGADAQPPPVAASTKAELDPSKPIEVGSNGQFFLSKHLNMQGKDKTVRLEHLFEEFAPDFEGKETEQNWMARDKHILALRKLNKGNAPEELHAVFLGQIKLFRDGILKVVNSLRTTPSTNACYLIQELARTLGSGIDPMVEWLMESLIKLCGHTKAISAQNANQTISTLINNVTFTKNLLLHISNASVDKNVRPRGFAQGWLKSLIGRYTNHKQFLEHNNGVDVLEKILKKGLSDQDPGVRESARDAYWSFNPLWPSRGETIMASLSTSHQNQLLQHASNPDKSQAATQVGSSSRSTFSKSTNAANRPSIREAMLAKKREKERLERPASAQATTSPTKSSSSRPQSTLVTGGLSSAPLRPARPKSAMRAEPPKPVKTAVKKPSSQSPTKPSSPTKAAEDLTMILPTVALGPAIDLVQRPKSSDSTSGYRGAPTKVPTIQSPKGIPPSMERPRSNHAKEVTGEPNGRPLISSDSGVGDAMRASTPEPLKKPRADQAAPASSPGPSRSPAKNAQSPVRPSTTEAVANSPKQDGSQELPIQVRDEGSPQITTTLSPKKENSPMKDILPESAVEDSDSNGKQPLAELSESQANNANENGDNKTARLIDSGIKRIAAKTLDAHGFRKLQSTINSSIDTLTTERLDDLLHAVIPRIGDDVSPADDRVLTQQLHLLKSLSQAKQSSSTSYMPEALTNVLMAMGRYEEQSRTQVTLESTFDELIKLPDFPTVPTASAIQGLVSRTQKAEDDGEQRTLGHALEGLGKLLGSSHNDGLPNEILGAAIQGIRHKDASIRKKAYNLAATVFKTMPDPAPFWTAVESLPKADQAMLHYVVEK